MNTAQPPKNPSFLDRPVGLIGAGVMGLGIVQVAALAGHTVLLHDAREGAAAAARTGLQRTLDGLVAKGRLDAVLAAEALARVQAVTGLDALAGCGLVIEAIVEQLEVKRALLADLEARVADDCVLASNTSSLSITALARGLRLPGRVVGMHFFNPVPLMKLVEVVSGLATAPEVAAAITALSRAWGKTPVAAASTPGFIVNRIARPYYAETLALLHERAAGPAALDACLRGAGFRMGPCELMDLIGQDTNFSVTQAVFEANFADRRYQPSLVQRALVDAGRLGRKSGQGFYAHGHAPAAALPPSIVSAPLSAAQASQPVTVHGHGPLADHLAQRVAAAGWPVRPAATGGPLDTGTGTRIQAGDTADAGHAGEPAPGAIGLTWPDHALWITDGRCATERAALAGAPACLAVLDLPIDPRAQPGAGVALAFALPDQLQGPERAAWADEVAARLQALGWAPVPLDDAPGLVVARTVAMLVNEACDAVQQGVCDEAGADAAMKLGVNWPAGPFEWLAAWGAAPVVAVLDALALFTRGERYRASPRLRRSAWQGQLAR